MAHKPGIWNAIISHIPFLEELESTILIIPAVPSAIGGDIIIEGFNPVG